MATPGKLSSKIKQLKFMQRAVAADTDRKSNRTTTEDPSVSQNRGQNSQHIEDWAVKASKTRCIVLTQTNPSIATDSRQGILSFGQRAGPIDVEEQQREALVEEKTGQSGMPQGEASGATKRKSPPIESVDATRHASYDQGMIDDTPAEQMVMQSGKRKKKKKKKRT